MRFRIPALALLAGVTAMMVSCDLMETPKVSQSAPSAAAIAARAQAIADSTTKYRDSLLACRKADSITAAATRKSWLSDSASFVAKAKAIAADSLKHLTADLKTRKTDSTAAAKARKTDSTKFAKDSLAGIKTLSADSLKIDKVMRNDSSAYERAKAAMWAKYTKDSILWEAAVNTKYAALLAKDSAAITAAEELIAAEDETTTDKQKAAHQTKLEKAQAKLVKDLATQQKAIDAALAKITKDSLAGEAAMAKVLAKRATDSTTYYGKFSKDSLAIVAKLSKDSTTWRTNFVRDSTKLYADSVAKDTKYAADTLARYLADSTKAAKTTADSLAMFKADSAFMYRKGVVSFSPAPGTYSSVTSKDITLSSGYTGTGAAIYYTTDGSVPTSASTLYTGPITLTIGATIRAIAVQAGYDTSVVIAGTYVIGTAATPTFSPVAGTYVDSQKVVVTSASDSIYYTLDGTVPTTSSAKVNTGDTIVVNKTGSLKAMAFLYGRTNSVVATAPYTIVADTPTIAFVNARQKVVITTGTIGASIRYTTNGTTPTAASTLYTDSVAISGTTTVKAIAVKTGLTSSAVASKTLTALPTPTFAFSGDHKTVTITSTGADSIVYTKDGTTPVYLNGTLNGTRIVAGGTVTLTSADTIKAVAFRKTGDTVNSAVGTGGWVAQATPTFSLANTDSTRVTITSGSGATAADSIYYTVNGTVPTSASLKIANGGKVTLTTADTIRAIAVKSGKYPSAMDSAMYSIQTKPSFSLGADYKTVTITSSGADSIFYTLNGTKPTAVRATNVVYKYTAPIVLTGADTVIAIAVKANTVMSLPDSGKYLQQATPTVTLGNDGKTVTFTSTGADSIMYTRDNSTPTATSGTKIATGGTLTLTGADTIKAIAVKSGKIISAIDTALLGTQQAKPTLTLGADLKTVTFTSASADSIKYTRDGSAPTATNGTKILTGGTLVLTGADTILAVAMKSGSLISAIDTSMYTQQATPTVTLGADGQSVIFASAGADSIMYTRDNSAPTVSHGTKVATGDTLTLTGADTILAVAVKAGKLLSATDTARFTAQATPTVAVGNDGKTVTFTSTSADSIMYTTDGSAPSISAGTKIATGGTLVLTAADTILAIAVKSGKLVSGIDTAMFTAQATPSIALGADAKTLTFTSASADSIMYTTDNSVPTASHGTKVATGGTLVLSGADTILAIAVKAGKLISGIDTAMYTQQAAPAMALSETDYKTVTFTEATADSIMYTTDNSVPTASHGTKVATGGTLVLSAGDTVLAIALKSGLVISSTDTGMFTAQVATTFGEGVLGAIADGGGTVADTIDTTVSNNEGVGVVTLTSAGADAIYYTTNGATPTTSSTLYSGPIDVVADKTIKALAVKAGKVYSLSTRDYVIK